MLKYFLLFVLSLLPLSATAESGMPVELQQFEGFSDILPLDEFGQERGTKRVARQQDIIPFIKSSIPETATYNLMNAEQIFCYHIAKRPKDYTGYTIDGMAVSGFCGELNTSTAATAYEALFTQSPNILTKVADCRIEPRIMLRFARGVDYTDVLLSSPCPSFTIFYAGRYKSFNIKQGIIDDIIKQLENTNEAFNSPTLLKQTVANGKPATLSEEEMLAKKQKENAPIMNWKQKQDSAAQTEEPEAAADKPKAGWGIKSWRQK